MMDDYAHLTDDELEAVHALESLVMAWCLEDEDSIPPTKVTAYTFRDRFGGLRIAELAVVWRGNGGGMCGSSWMASDVDAAAVLFEAERYLLVHDAEPEVYDGSVGDKYDPSIYDPEQEARNGLRYAIYGDFLPEWEHRFPRGFRRSYGAGGEWYDADKAAAYGRHLEALVGGAP